MAMVVPRVQSFSSFLTILFLCLAMDLQAVYAVCRRVGEIFKRRGRDASVS
ncbi:hypothetical protein M758_12G040200 [Ceratodon purpureus]|uniref:Uncharacterized protein n=1 Tax=Ceratodon purpureus TaxID=3225 RepID=A0A8T0G6U8_CERPU|nr:hypothetical protein KC19_12G039200 [Ceratodon purpureus]KAG0598040.1 hypothetical protein M758_12G040200 [Ceratodon purpureus]